MTTPTGHRKRWYTSLSTQVLIGIGLAIALGYVSPERAAAMRPLGDAFIRLITMIISLVIFCTVVSGIAGMQNLKKVGRVGGKALLYFEIVGCRVFSFSVTRVAGEEGIVGLTFFATRQLVPACPTPDRVV
jgi:Na+/H+-dicarboxylate symporter